MATWQWPLDRHTSSPTLPADKEKQVPGKPKGTVKGKKITAAQQRLFGTARGMQESGKGSSSAAGKIAKTIAPSDLHNIAKKPKGGFRKKK
jgi:phage terminase small subunit